MLVPEISYEFFKSEKAPELNVNKENENHVFTKILISYVDLLNSYYKRNPINLLLENNEVESLKENKILINNPKIKIIFYDNEKVEDYFEVYNSSFGLNGFFPYISGDGIRSGTEESDLNKNIECYVKIGENFINKALDYVEHMKFDNYTKRFMLTTTLFHELKHIEDFLSLSAGNAPDQAMDLITENILNYNLDAMSLGINIEDYLVHKENYEMVMEKVEQRVEESGRSLNRRLDNFVSPELIKEFESKVLNKNKKNTMIKKP